MSITGIVYEQVDAQLATVETEIEGQYLMVKVLRKGIELIKFPLPKTADLNEVALRVANVINQTRLVENPVRVETSEV